MDKPPKAGAYYNRTQIDLGGRNGAGLDSLPADRPGARVRADRGRGRPGARCAPARSGAEASARSRRCSPTGGPMAQSPRRWPLRATWLRSRRACGSTRTGSIRSIRPPVPERDADRQRLHAIGQGRRNRAPRLPGASVSIARASRQNCVSAGVSPASGSCSNSIRRRIGEDRANGSARGPRQPRLDPRWRRRSVPGSLSPRGSTEACATRARADAERSERLRPHPDGRQPPGAIAARARHPSRPAS